MRVVSRFLLFVRAPLARDAEARVASARLPRTLVDLVRADWVRVAFAFDARDFVALAVLDFAAFVLASVRDPEAASTGAGAVVIQAITIIIETPISLNENERLAMLVSENFRSA